MVAQASHADEPPIRALALDPMLANVFAERIGATLRQVQLWTDQRVILCLPETHHQGRGRKNEIIQEVSREDVPNYLAGHVPAVRFEDHGRDDKSKNGHPTDPEGEDQIV